MVYEKSHTQSQYGQPDNLLSQQDCINKLRKLLGMAYSQEHFHLNMLLIVAIGAA